MGISVPLNDENKFFINAAFQGYSIETFTKKRMISYLKFQIQVAQDASLLDSLQDTMDKVERMTEQDWSLLVLNLPFQILSYDGNEDEAEE